MTYSSTIFLYPPTAPPATYKRVTHIRKSAECIRITQLVSGAQPSELL